MKLTRKTKVLIKDLDKQIDYLVGYSNNGLHWKQEYWARQNLINAVMADEMTPPEIKQKIDNIFRTIENIKDKNHKTNQDYFKAHELELETNEPVQTIIFYGSSEFSEYIIKTQLPHSIKVNDHISGTTEYIELEHKLT